MSIIKSAVAVSVLALSLVALPVSANAALSDCGANKICLWQNSDFGGSYYQASSSSPSPVTINYLFNFGVSSWKNGQSRDAKWYPLINGGGAGHCMNSNSWTSYVGWLDNDALQSMTIYTDSLAC